MARTDYQRKLDELMLELQPAFTSLGFKKRIAAFTDKKMTFGSSSSSRAPSGGREITISLLSMLVLLLLL
jgi:hypothetical protein